MPNQYAFRGGDHGSWRISSMGCVMGEPLAAASHLDICLDTHSYVAPTTPTWCLRGAISNLRYAMRSEVTSLRAVQEPLGRRGATHAALIPIKKSAAWWDLAQDERRAVFEEQSHHTAIGLDYLPAVSRQLYHSRDLGEPFDFITWFEYAPDAAASFETLVARLRASPEWHYVEREVDIRLVRAA